tara:strand:+ start:5798 stop:6136 length:339 start_codon:yes stop_codon:yes gene_type:complete
MKPIVDHIAVLVDDLNIAEDWYIKNLGGIIIFKDEKYIRIKLQNTSIALIDKNHYPYPHFAILVDNKCDLPINKGIVVKHRNGTTGVYIKDPFGNYLEYIWYSKDQKKVFLK